jgi:hypothetical protein
VEHDVEGEGVDTPLIDPEKIGDYDEVGRAADGQELCDALNGAEEDRFEEVQARSPGRNLSPISSASVFKESGIGGKGSTALNTLRIDSS